MIIIKKQLIGSSGIVHEVDVVEINGKEYIFADLNERFESILSKLLIAIDARKPIYLLTDKPIPLELRSLLHNVEVKIGARGKVKAVREVLAEISSKVATAKWYLKAKGLQKDLTRRAMLLLSDFYEAQLMDEEIVEVLSSLLEDVPEMPNAQFLCELIRRYGCPRCGSRNIELKGMPAMEPYKCRCLNCGFTVE
ncbi:MAG: hypothetical protein QW701_03000 [Candidatus Nezhaarchaeales archaeon]